MLPRLLLTCFALSFVNFAFADDEARPKADEFTRQDHLRGAITPEREWWDVQHYHLTLQVFPDERQFVGSNIVTFKVLKPHDRMQIDLQKPLKITRVSYQDASLEFEREGNVYWITFPSAPEAGTEQSIEIFYEGEPTESIRPPWTGGLTWAKDPNGNHFIATSCQGIGASIWWPNKDHCYEEPDRGMDMTITIPESLTAVCNGRLISTKDNAESHTRTFHWRVVNPINNYAVNLNIGDYVRLQETIKAESGPLDMDYWVLSHQKDTAEKHFREAPRTINALEYWFGPYPFYEDSYKLVVVPYLGMEHQSSVTYGNKFQNGYNGRDLSGTGVGMKFDFIIVHESGHEWFGNNITAKDIADMWVQEGFTNYSENLFVNYHFSRSEAEDYVIGCRSLVRNDKPIIGIYNVNKSGSGDMYYKAGNMLHTIRNAIDNDSKWRSILRGLNADFRHQTVTTKQIEDYVSEHAGMDLSTVFEQYLRTTKIPTLILSRNAAEVSYRFEDVVDNFHLRTKALVDGKPMWIEPTTEPQSLTLPSPDSTVTIDRNFFFNIKQGNVTDTPASQIDEASDAESSGK